ncbi:hypothetical protein LCS78_11420 [Vibrio harveyi]|uniref:hypothetical protein n=1 Tax=Vibrio harveyi TaxID=669 RepID=UPI00237FA339|nr:hypothetical protein [Vibrio harveyi]HDM8069018.1 hypothetical protein [Vibrio harveyi]
MKQLILIFLSIIMLSGCQEPSDEACVELDGGMKTIEKMSFSEHFSICKSKDKTISIIDTFHDTDDNPLNKYFEENQHIDADQAASKNALQSKLNDITKFSHKLYKSFAVFLTVFSTLAVLSILTVAIRRLANAENQQKFSLKKSAFCLTIATTIAGLHYASPQFQITQNQAAVSYANGLSKNLMSFLIDEAQSDHNYQVKNSRTQAELELVSLFDTNTCLSNNRKYEIGARDLASREFEDQKAAISYYKKKNDAYFPLLEDKKHRGFKLYFHDRASFPTLTMVNADGCSSLVYSQNEYSHELGELMREVKFSETVFKAVGAKDYKSGWDTLNGAFDSIYKTKSELIKNRKSQLLIAYRNEYQKGLVVGYVKFNDNGKPIAFERSSLDHWLSLADKHYEFSNKKMCALNSQIVQKAKNDFDEYLQTNVMFDYHCLTFNKGDSVQLISDKVYQVDGSDKEVMLNDIDYYENQAKDIFNSAVDELASQYDVVNQAFYEQIHEIYDVEERLVELYNEGFKSFNKFWKVLKTGNGEYQHLFSSAAPLSIFDTSKSLPYYQSRSDLVSEPNYDLYSVDRMAGMYSYIDLNKAVELVAKSNSFGSVLLKDKYQVDSVDVEQSGTALESAESNILDEIQGLNNEMMKLYCVKDSTTTSQELLDCQINASKGQGKQTYNDVQEVLLINGGKAFLGGLGAKVSSSLTSAIAKAMLDQNTGKKKIKTGKKNKAAVLKNITAKTLDATSTTANFLGGLSMKAGFVFFLFGLLMQLPELFAQSVNHITQLSIVFELKLYPFLIAYVVAQMYFLSTDSTHHVKALGKIALILAAPYMLATTGFLALSTLLYVTDLVINFLPIVFDFLSLNFTATSGHDSFFEQFIGLFLDNMTGLILLGGTIYYLINIGSHMMRLTDALDDVSLKKTTADDAYEQNKRTFDLAVVAGSAHFNRFSKSLNEKLRK